MITEQQYREVEVYAQNILDTARDPLLIVDSELRVKTANRAFYRVFKTSPAQTEGRHITALGNGQWNSNALVELLQRIVPGETEFDDYEITASFPDIGTRVMLLNARRLCRPVNHQVLIAIGIEDITSRRLVEDETAEASDRDRRIAASLQRALLFKPAEDAFPGLAVSTAYGIGSDEAMVGGDFWDTFAFGDSKVAFVLGDVMGKGLKAAVFTSELRYTIRAFVREHHEPARALQQSNAHVHEVQRLFGAGLNAQGDDAPVCVSLTVIDTVTGNGSVCTAGMEPLLHIKNNGDIALISAVGFPLGIEPNATYSAAEFSLASGDTLVISTDGITEARCGNDYLGYDGFVALATAANKLPTLTRAATYILDGARDFANGKLHDDASLLMARKL